MDKSDLNYWEIFWYHVLGFSIVGLAISMILLQHPDAADFGPAGVITHVILDTCALLYLFWYKVEKDHKTGSG